MIRYIIGSVFGGFIALIGAYFKGKSVVKEQVRVKELEKEIDNQNEVKKIKKRVNKSKSDSRNTKLSRLRKRVKAK